jgi:class 3 adenylate cyclase
VAARAELPSGTVTLLFTDIEGSTKLLQEFGERYAEVLAEHRRLIREAALLGASRLAMDEGDAERSIARAKEALRAARASGEQWTASGGAASRRGKGVGAMRRAQG